MRLNSFFAKPTAAQAEGSGSSSNFMAISPKKGSSGDRSNAGVSSSDGTSAVSDYQREFPDFFLQSHTKIAPTHRFQRDSEALRHVCEKVDAYLKSGQSDSPKEQLVFRPSALFHIMPYKRRCGKQIPIKEILLKMQNQDQGTPVSLGQVPGIGSATKLQNLLRKVTMKSLKFGEDVRPPYQGTFTRAVPVSVANKLSRNPFSRALPDTNYDYDSEAEWEEPEEGEDLDSEEEEEISEDGDDDMDGFLDDEDDQLKDGRRRPIVGDLEPVCTGLCWQDEGPHPELEAYRIETIPESVTFPIDPFSSAYWQKPKSEQVPPKAAVQSTSSGRSTLHAFAVTSSAHSQSAGASKGSLDEAIPTTQTTGKAKRLFPPDQLTEFKQAVQGSDLTKAGLIEILKKRFPKVSKDVLKETLNQTAVRVGQKEAEKKWVCL
ncbi:hypothetical protein MPDQ_004531 [Monascus purpureus]|uniref:Uncharacterized protein n=1 Tax=Monascus purpureus TaxID=5098 RepID=A0A507QH81_MONPU|nr:hypothetical protein MPDQ_004531 [Monascus purpureus]BDD58703.1 hypothetical protein MAP00_003961 [Monascus purpureus]